MRQFLYLIYFSFLSLFGSQIVLANNYDFEMDSGLSDAGFETDQYDKDISAQSEKTLPQKIGKVIGAILAFTSIIFFILMIYGGILWMTAAGNDEQTKKAMNVITAAIVGVVIVASAYAITAYIGGVL